MNRTRNLGPPALARSLLPWALALSAVSGLGCASGPKRSPEGLRDAYAAALRTDDPDAAYALLTPDLQARTGIEAFRARWRDNSAAHKNAQKAIAELPDDRRAAVLTATTTHEGGLVLHWAHTSEGYLVVDGLPGVPDTSTPAATARALIGALRGISSVQLERVLATPMLERIGEDWTARADAIEAALLEPGSISYSGDNARAVLRYGAGRAITFEQTAQGWRIAELR